MTDLTAVQKNEAAMFGHDIKIGDVYRRGYYGTVTVLGPADTWPRNNHGLVRCEVRYRGCDSEPEISHFWPQTLAASKLVKRALEERGTDDA
jgi:hypothetical protein